MNGSTYVGVTHSGPPSAPAANLSIYKLHKDLNLTLVRVYGRWSLCDSVNPEGFHVFRSKL